MSQKIIYIDMDGVLCDFEGAAARDKKAFPDRLYPQSRAGFYRNLTPIAGAIEAMDVMLEANNIDPYILTAPSLYNPLSYTEKRLWVEDYLGFEWVKRLIISPDKSLLKGDVLIDDHNAGRGQDRFQGDLIHFGSPQFSDWTAVMEAVSLYQPNTSIYGRTNNMPNPQDDYTIILSQDTFERIKDYAASLRAGGRSGVNLAHVLKGTDLQDLYGWQLLSALLNSKKPQIFAEMHVSGDGSDWTLKELSLLGDISIGMTVTIFDNGAHQAPDVHETPFTGHLIYMPGALLRNDRDDVPADWRAVTENGEYNRDKYYALYERRLLPAFGYINAQAIQRGRPAFISIPGIGCGQFAGPFRGQMGHLLQAALVRFLKAHGERFSAIKAVYYDPYNECINHNQTIHNIEFIVRPLMDNFGKSQLCSPQTLGEDSAGDFDDCELYSFVAWDHVSWPGNDYYLGARETDDGVKAAATNTMHMMTGIEGHYVSIRNRYEPPKPYNDWREVVRANKLTIKAEDNHYIV